MCSGIVAVLAVAFAAATPDDLPRHRTGDPENE
jgi:hypothetical protein